MEKVEVGNRADIIFNLMVDLGFTDEEFAFMSGVIDSKLELNSRTKKERKR